MTAAKALPADLIDSPMSGYLDCCIHVKVRDSGTVCTKAVYLVLGIFEGVAGHLARPDRGREVLLQVMTELKNRGVQDIFIACVDGLKGFPEAHRDRLTDDRRAAYRANGALLSKLRELKIAQGSRRGFARHLHPTQ